jgi:HlyD family secretion protein
MKKRLLWLAVLVVLAAAGVAYWRYRESHKPPEAVYKTAPVEKRHIVGKVTASGTLSAIVTVLVGTQVSGRVSKLYADYNSHVKKGELVAKIDPQLFEAALQQANANYLQAKAGVVSAKAAARGADLQFARTKALKEANLAAQQDLDTAEATVGTTHAAIDAANAQLAQAAAQLNTAQVNLSYTSIISPIDGVVISRSVDTGQTVAASLSAPTLFTIAQDLTKMQVDTSVSEGDVGRLQVDMKTYFTVDSFPGQRFVGTIRQIRNAATTVQNVVTYDAVIDVDNTDLRLRPGMTANVTIVYEERRDVLAVSNAALRFRPPPSLAGSSSGEHEHGGAGGAGQHRHPHGAGSAAAAGDPPEAKEGKDGKDAPAAIEAKIVWVMRGSVIPVAVTVHVGLTDGTVTEIVDGDLKEGDQVVVDTLSADGSSPSAAGGAAQTRRLF